MIQTSSANESRSRSNRKYPNRNSPIDRDAERQQPLPVARSAARGVGIREDQNLLIRDRQVRERIQIQESAESSLARFSSSK